jgi:hypothetical protein
VSQAPVARTRPSAIHPRVDTHSSACRAKDRPSTAHLFLLLLLAPERLDAVILRVQHALHLGELSRLLRLAHGSQGSELPRARDIRASTVGDSCNAGGSGRPARRGATWDHHTRRVRAPSDLPARAPCCGGGQCGGFDVAVIACGAGVELLRFLTLCLPVCPRCCIGRLAQYRDLPRSASRALQHVPAGDVSPRLRPRALPVPPVCGSCLAPNVTPSTNACVCSRACACSRAHESAAIWDVRLRAGLQDWF